MRELNDCRAEVFRRSEKRIEKHRKCKKWLLASFVPLILCAAVLLIPENPDLSTGGTAQEMIGAVNGASSGVEIRGSGSLSVYSNKITDPAQVGKIYDTLQGYMTSGVDGGANGESRPPAAQPSIGSEFTITFLATGENYIISGNQLTNKQTGQIVKLSDGQLAQLKELLGLTS